MVEKIKTGILGLNALLDGGLNERSATVVIGAAGAGKTTFANQFIRRGLMDGQVGIFISLDENKEQIIKDALNMGWEDILYFIEEEKLIFIDASGKEIQVFIKRELPDFVSRWEGSNVRIAIDPLTPVIWATPSRYQQRELLSLMLKELKKIGTIVATLEEHGNPNLSSPETGIPMYLADTVIHLRYNIGEDYRRELHIVKMRGSRHSERTHPYRIIKGLGIVVARGHKKMSSRENVEVLRRKIKEKMKKASPLIMSRIEKVLEQLEDVDIEDVNLEELAEIIAEEFI